MLRPLDGRVQIANPAIARMLGYDSPEEFVRGVQDLGTQVYRRSEDRAEVLRQTEEQGQLREVEVELVRKDGGHIWVSINGRAVRDAQRNTVRYESTLGDITHRKLAEKLTATEHQVAKILATAPAQPDALSGTLRALGQIHERGWCAVWRIDPRDQVLRCAEVWHPGTATAVEFERYCRSVSFGAGAGLLGRCWGAGELVWSPDVTADRDSPRACCGSEPRHLRGAVAFPLLVGKDVLGVIELFGHETRAPEPALVRTLHVIGGQIGQFVERRQVEEERDRFFNLSVDMLCVAGFDGVFQLVNAAWAATLGWTTEELTSRPYAEFVRPDDRAATAAEAEQLTSGGSALSFENRYRCKDGSYRWLSWRAVADPVRRVVYASARDTTEKRHAEAELRPGCDRAHPGRQPGGF